MAAGLEHHCFDGAPVVGDLLRRIARQRVEVLALRQTEQLPFAQVQLDADTIELVANRARNQSQILC